MGAEHQDLPAIHQRCGGQSGRADHMADNRHHARIQQFTIDLQRRLHIGFVVAYQQLDACALDAACGVEVFGCQQRAVATAGAEVGQTTGQAAGKADLYRLRLAAAADQ